MRMLPGLLAAFLLLAACGGGGPIAMVGDVSIESADLEALHIDVDRLDEDEVAGSMLLLILHEAFTARAEAELGLGIDAGLAAQYFAGRAARYPTLADMDLDLAAQNRRAQRLRLESDLDALSNAVGAHLVRAEADGFDLDRAYEDYLLVNAEVCVLQIQLEDADRYDEAEARVDGGEPFAAVALDMSLDPFVARDDGGTGAGGDIGCSAPAALPSGLDRASLNAPVGEPYGPVGSTLGVHLIVVTDRAAPELVEVRPDVVEFAVDSQGPDLFRAWAVNVLQTIEVDIDTDYGAWGVLPETDPVPTVVSPGLVDQIIE